MDVGDNRISMHPHTRTNNEQSQADIGFPDGEEDRAQRPGQFWGQLLQPSK
jgi:hypothetical protein